MSTEPAVPGLYQTQHEHVLKMLENISDMPYWSLNLEGEDVDFGLEHFQKWTEEEGYRYFVMLEEDHCIERIYCVNVNENELKWWVIHGGGWNGIRRIDGKWDDEGHYLDYNWPTDATVMMWGTWNAVRYFNIKEAVGYEPERIAEEMGADLLALHKIFMASGDHYLRHVDLPQFPMEVPA